MTQYASNLIYKPGTRRIIHFSSILVGRDIYVYYLKM